VSCTVNLIIAVMIVDCQCITMAQNRYQFIKRYKTDINLSKVC